MSCSYQLALVSNWITILRLEKLYYHLFILILGGHKVGIQREGINWSVTL